MLFELTSAVAKIQKESRAVFKDYYPGKRIFESSVQNGSTETFERMILGYLTKM